MPLVISTCTICQEAISGLAGICYACTDARDGVQTGGNAGAPTVLTAHDCAAIKRFAQLRLSAGDPVTEALLRKLDGARIVPADAVDADVATLGSRIVFSVRGGHPEARVLVLPTEHTAAGWTLPVTTPRGMALLGHAAGSVVTAARPDGAPEQLRLLSIVHQPEAASLAAVAARQSGGRPVHAPGRLR